MSLASWRAVKHKPGDKIFAEILEAVYYMGGDGDGDSDEERIACCGIKTLTINDDETSPSLHEIEIVLRVQGLLIDVIRCVNLDAHRAASQHRYERRTLGIPVGRRCGQAAQRR